MASAEGDTEQSMARVAKPIFPNPAETRSDNSSAGIRNAAANELAATSAGSDLAEGA